jgi:hypothetical protein
LVFNSLNSFLSLRANGVAPITGTYTKYATVAPLGSALYRKNDVKISLIASAVNKITNLEHNKIIIASLMAGGNFLFL